MQVGNQLSPATPRQKNYLRQLMRKAERPSSEIEEKISDRLTQSMASHEIKKFQYIAELVQKSKLINLPGVPQHIKEANREAYNKELEKLQQVYGEKII